MCLLVACEKASTENSSYQARLEESFKDVSVSTVGVLCSAVYCSSICAHLFT